MHFIYIFAERFFFFKKAKQTKLSKHKDISCLHEITSLTVSRRKFKNYPWKSESELLFGKHSNTYTVHCVCPRNSPVDSCPDLFLIRKKHDLS